MPLEFPKCDGCSIASSELTCFKCEENFCPTCDLKLHSSIKTRQHPRIPYRGEIPSRFCSLHKEIPLTLLCQTCSRTICPSCVLSGDHKSHRYVDLLLAKNKVKIDLKIFEEEIERKISNHRLEIEQKEKELKKIIEEKEKELRMIRATLNQEERDLMEVKMLQSSREIESQQFVTLASELKLMSKYQTSTSFGCDVSSSGWELGLFYYLGVQSSIDKKTFVNPHNVLVDLTYASQRSDEMYAWRKIFQYPAQGLCAHSSKDSHQWITVSLRPPLTFHLTHYAIRARGDYDNYHPRYWKLEGSKDQKNWILLSSHEKDRKLKGLHTVAKWTLSHTSYDYFSHFRFTQTGMNSSGTHHLLFQSLEFYGHLPASLEK